MLLMFLMLLTFLRVLYLMLLMFLMVMYLMVLMFLMVFMFLHLAVAKAAAMVVAKAHMSNVHNHKHNLPIKHITHHTSKHKDTTTGKACNVHH